eukprot:CAMPEP_0113458968 /NCGR_PEP_ID=MMETSP0014_2-20120614/10198_1 /TAXON_ID=2857 /ORGANISM="Nitzschia sp." /LENGTH=722 /DNA_ID=CAMNT_0000350513 /DNA_START=281 /DNA_END=2452 /DNA_ORIENTATION=- /assembly_acc=CAM_ASM_000159
MEQTQHSISTTTNQQLLRDVLRQNNVLVGGSSIGKGFVKAASYFLDHHHDDGSSSSEKAPAVEEDEKKDDGGRISVDSDDPYYYLSLCNNNNNIRREDPFYVVDLGVVVSQVYQWWKLFPRVEAFYAVKCNPDPVVIKTLAVMGLNFDCASRTEIQLVQECCKDIDVEKRPEIIYANPCKAPTHIQDAVVNHGVRLMTFDNINEIIKCSKISSSTTTTSEIQLIMRIATDDQGSRCRFSTKFGAPRIKWRPLLAAAKKYSINVVGVSFHVGSGCHDASKYDLALKDAREIFDVATNEYGMDMTIVDIGGGFPGETHSLWNPAKELDDGDDEAGEDDDEKEGQSDNNSQDKEEEDEEGEEPLVYFQEIAESVAPAIDKYFPKESGVRIIGEPGRYLVAAAATLCCSIIGLRDNQLDSEFVPEPVDDKEAAMMVNDMTREDEFDVIDAASGNIFESSSKKLSMGGQQTTDDILGNIVDELADYTRMFARQNLAQQEVDTYNDSIDVYALNEERQLDVLGVPETGTETDTDAAQTVEGMNSTMVDMVDSQNNAHPLVALAGAGEAAVSGLVMQAVADASAVQDDFAVYINDGVYGAMNNIMFDHANLRPRVLRKSENTITATKDNDGMAVLDTAEYTGPVPVANQELFATTVFGPTCDSIDVVARSVLLPKLKIGDWLYFQNMGAYTMAAASSFNGFEPSEKVYVCSIHPEYIETMMAGPDAVEE